jgi:hypothetical protein
MKIIAQLHRQRVQQQQKLRLEHPATELNQT